MVLSYITEVYAVKKVLVLLLYFVLLANNVAVHYEIFPTEIICNSAIFLSISIFFFIEPNHFRCRTRFFSGTAPRGREPCGN